MRQLRFDRIKGPKKDIQIDLGVFYFFISQKSPKKRITHLGLKKGYFGLFWSEEDDAKSLNGRLFVRVPDNFIGFFFPSLRQDQNCFDYNDLRWIIDSDNPKIKKFIECQNKVVIVDQTEDYAFYQCLFCKCF